VAVDVERQTARELELAALLAEQTQRAEQLEQQVGAGCSPSASIRCNGSKRRGSSVAGSVPIMATADNISAGGMEPLCMHLPRHGDSILVCEILAGAEPAGAHRRVRALHHVPTHHHRLLAWAG
jgi:hypothetical protein